MQYFYTHCATLLSNFRTALSLCGRRGHSLSVHSLRAVILLGTLTLSCGVWGAETITSVATTWEYSADHSAKNFTSNNGDNGLYFNANANTNYIKLQSNNILHFNIPSGVSGTLTVTYTPQSNDYVALDMYIDEKLTDTKITNKKAETTQTFNIPLTTSQASVYLKSTRSSSKDPNSLTSSGKQINVSKLVWSPVSVAADNTIYLRPNSNWLQSNARFAVYYWDASSTGWVDMTRTSDCEEVYTASIPANYTNLIFCRMNPGTTENSFTNDVKWNQTGDLTITKNDLYELTENSNNWSDGSWTAYAPATFSISFDANGGTGTMASIADITCGGTATLTENTFTRANYTFAGWNTQADGKGTTYADKASITDIKTDLTLYAQWTGVDYWYVSGDFNNFGLTHPFTDNQVAITLAANTTYQFKIQHQVGDTYIWYGNKGEMTSTNCTNWNFGSLGEDNVNAKITTTVAGTYIFTMSVNDNGTPKLTVTYPALCTITYNANRPTTEGDWWNNAFYAADIPTETTSVGYGDSYTLSANTPAIVVKEGSDYAIYTFAGWNTQADGKGTTYQAGATIPSVSGDMTLYAQWTPRPFNITYYDDDQTTTLNLTPNTYTYPVSTTFPTPTKQGYSFLGWKTEPAATTYITKTDGYHGDFTLYAEWETFCGEMMRATITGQTTATLTGTYAGSAEVNVAKGNATNGYKLGSDGQYVKLTLKDATFQAGDYVVVNVITASTCLDLYADKGTTRWRQVSNIKTGENIIYLPAEAVGKSTVYLYRTSSEMNPFITYMSIGRPCCTIPTFEWVNQPQNSRVQDADFEMSTTSNSGGAVTYQSNNTNVATIVDGNKLHFVGEGAVTITATLAATDNYCEAFLSSTIDVTDQCGESSVIYTLPVGKDVKALETAKTAEATDGLTAEKTITATEVTLGTSGNARDGEGLTVSISNTSALDKNKYLSFAYTVADGKCFTPCDVLLKVQPISNDCSFLIEMTDGTYTLLETTTSLAQGQVHTIRFHNPDNISFCGQVALKIYSYGATSGYRLGTPIRILGTLGTSVTATIDPNGGTIPDAAASGWILQQDGTYTKQIPQGSNLTMPSITRNGYTLTAYHDHNSDLYYPGNTFPLPKDYTFTAQWRAVAPDGSVTATLDPNGGVLADETGWTKQIDGTYIQTVKKGSDFTLPQITKEGYRFLYYTDETNGDFYPSETFTLDADYTFTAQWCSATINLSLEWSVAKWVYGNGDAPTLTATGLPADAQIKYVSSNTAVAIISDDGTEIKSFMEGETEITAIYDGDENYCPARASYILKVECNEPTPLIVGEGVLTGCNNSITLRVVQQADKSDYPATGYTFQWYKDGQAIAGATEATYTAQAVGEYFVVVHGSRCYAQSVNTAKITSQSATPEVTTLTRFQYYRREHTYTDNAATRHLFAYRSAGSDTHRCNITAVRKRAGATDETITDLSFIHTVQTADANGCDTVTALLNEVPADIDLKAGDTLVVTLTPYDNCNELATAYARSINIYIIDKPALAFIISGADSYTRNKEKHKLHGDFLTGINKADLCKQSGINWAESDKQTELPLYTALKNDFEVVPVNGYATFNRLNYEPFDIVMLTDFPKTDAISKETKPAYSVLDSLAYLVDYRPMFSLKGHMAKKELTTWASKGFIADPATPSVNPQTDMTVLCYAHGIFDGLLEKASGTGTTKTDSLNNIIRDADNNIIVRITDGGGYNKKKSLQGFVAVDANNFVNIAIIPEGKSGGSLVACCERQTNINARLLLLSVNADATSKITPIGEQAIIKGLTYLLETDAAKVSDCSVTFHNNNGTGDHLWTTAANWSTGRVPLKEQNVQIIEDCIVNTIDATAANILIEEDNTLTINSNAALKTTGKIKQMAADNHSNTSALTNPNIITIKADANGTGALIHTTGDDETLAATVQLYSKAYLKIVDGKKKKYWQYIGIPVQEAPIPDYFQGAYTYLYTEQAGGWTRQFDGTSLYGDFSGYATSQPAPETFVLKGNLASTAERRIRLTNTADGGQGSNLIGNSWTAPIRIDQMQTSDFNGADATIYIYNTGRDDVEDNPSYVTGSETAGQWMGIPVNLAATTEWAEQGGLRVIPAMQAFQVNTGEETELVLNYNRLVRSSTTTDINSPLRAPKRTDDALSVMRVRVSDSRTYTDLYLAQHPFFSDEFDNGWDATYIEGDGRSASLYAITPLGEMAVAAQPQTDGTVLGFTPGRETEYTFSFGYTGEMLYLNDTKQKRSTLITDWNTYTFTTSENDDVNRFYISSTPIDVQTPTGIANLTTTDGILRLSNPAHEDLQIGIYDAAGRLCALSHTTEAMTNITLPATQGVYLIHINGENTRIVHKVTR